MSWWILAAISICAALLIQYLCSSKILRMKQIISIKNMAMRDVHTETERLEGQETELQNQQTSLGYSIQRLRRDIQRLRTSMQSEGLDIPDPAFPLTELEEEEGEAPPS